MDEQAGSSRRDAKISKAHELVGLAISSWVLIEDALAGTLGACLGTSYLTEHDGNPGGLMTGGSMISGSVMHSQTGFSAKLSVATEALHGAFYAIGMPDNIRIEWNKLRNDLDKSSRLRNNLAHWSIMLTEKDGDLEPILQPSWSTGHLKQVRSARYSPVSMDIVRQYTSTFYDLWRRILEFNKALAKTDGLQSFLLKSEIDIINAMNHNCPKRLEHLVKLIHERDPDFLKRTHDSIVKLMRSVDERPAG